MIGGGRPLLPEILGQPAPVGAKSTALLCLRYITTLSIIRQFCISYYSASVSM